MSGLHPTARLAQTSSSGESLSLFGVPTPTSPYKPLSIQDYKDDHKYDNYEEEDESANVGSEEPISLNMPTLSLQQTLQNFTWMSILFSANHGCVVACLGLATTQLGSIGAWQSGILYMTYTMTALLGATYLVKQWGARNSLVVGMSLFIAYVGCFVVAIMHPSSSSSKNNNISPRQQELAAYFGAVVGGVGAGILWTAQGAYFSQAASAHAQWTTMGVSSSESSSSAHVQSSTSTTATNKTSSATAASSSSASASSTSLLAGTFAFWYLAEEVSLRLLSTLLLELHLTTWKGIFILYTAITVLSSMAMFLCIHDYSIETKRKIRRRRRTTTTRTGEEDSSSTTTGVWWYKATAAIQLLHHDPKMKYMIGFNSAYGFASAFCNSYVNGEVVPVALRDDNAKWLGLLTAWGSAVAAGMSLTFGWWLPSNSRRMGGKDSIIIAGASCFLGVALLFVIVPDATQWGWVGLVLVYSLMGMGRATFESTLKAIFADYFAYETEGAFANIIVQNGLSGAIGYILTFSLSCETPSRYCVAYRDESHQYILVFELLIVVSSVAGIWGYRRASVLHRLETSCESEQ